MPDIGAALHLSVQVNRSVFSAPTKCPIERGFPTDGRIVLGPLSVDRLITSDGAPSPLAVFFRMQTLDDLPGDEPK